MMRSIAVIVDGVWQWPQVNDDVNHSVDARKNSHVSNPSSGEVDHIVVLLSQVVQMTQSLSEQDQRRVRDFVHSASAMLSATTYLPKSDQRLFEAALRDVAARKYG